MEDSRLFSFFMFAIRNIFKCISPLHCKNTEKGDMNLNTLRFSRFKREKCCASIVVFALLISIVMVTQLSTRTKAEGSYNTLSLPPTVNLTLVGINGNVVFLNSSEILSFPSIRVSGGFRNKLGVVTGPDNFTGVSLNALANIVGGVNSSEVLSVIAPGYVANFTYSQVNGVFPTYSKVGAPTEPTKPLTPIVAYCKDDQNFSASEGPLRLTIVGDESLMTDSSLWVKNVAALEVLFSSVPITAVKPSRTIAGAPFICYMNVTLANNGVSLEYFNLTLNVLLNSTTSLITTRPVALPDGTVTNLVLSWNTTGFVYGNYNITAKAIPTLGTTAKGNILSGGTVLISIAGDANGDKKINVLDLITIAITLGTHTDGPNWNSNADINSDGKINVLDLIACAIHLGQQWP